MFVSIEDIVWIVSAHVVQTICLEVSVVMSNNQLGRFSAPTCLIIDFNKIVFSTIWSWHSIILVCQMFLYTHYSPE